MSDVTLRMLLKGRDDGASRALRDVGDASDHVEKKQGRLAGALKTTAKVAAVGLAGAVVAGGVALGHMAKAAAEDEVGQKRLATALHNTAGATKTQVAATESWISKQGVAYGVADDDLRPALGRLAAATHDVGKAQKLATLAMDISAGSGKSLEAVSTALAKAQNGNVGSLSRLGIKTKDSVRDQAALQAANIKVTEAQDKYTEALNEFGPKSKEAHLAASKLEYAQTRLGEAQGKVKQTTITADEAMQRLAKTYGGQAATKANTFQGKMDRLKLVFDETKESIGAKLLPILTKLAEWFLSKGVPAISQLWSWLSEKLGPVFAAIGHFIGDQVVPAVKKMIDQLHGASGKTGALSKAFQDLKPFLTLVGNILANVVGPALKWIASVIIPVVVTQFAHMAKVLGTVGDIGLWLWNKALAPTFRFIVTGVGQMMVLWGKMLTALGKVPGFGWAAEAGRKMQDAGGDAVGFANKIKAIPSSKNTDIGTTGIGAASSAVKAYRQTLDSLPANVRTQIVTQHTDKFTRITGQRARGGPVSPRSAYLVGEKGPEIVEFGSAGRVRNARDTAAALGGGGNGDLGTVTLDLQMEGRTVQKALLKLKRENGGLTLGLA